MRVTCFVALASVPGVECASETVRTLYKTRNTLHRIIAVGDSITWGSRSSNRGTSSWPRRLQNDYLHSDPSVAVFNFGVPGSTLQRSGDKPYVEQEEYALALASEPDAVVIMLGTNDAKFYNWDAAAYEADYEFLVS